MIRKLLLQPENRGQIAVVEDGQSISYHNLIHKAVAVQKRLPSIPAAHIAIFLPNSADYIVALFGTLMAGKRVLPLNMQLTPFEIAPLLAQAHARVVITSRAAGSFFSGISQATQIIYMEDIQAAADAVCPQPVKMDINAPMILLCTSGSMGKAKIVCLSEKNVEAAVLGFSSYNNYEKFSSVKYILGTPFSSVYGLLILCACLLKAFPIIIPREAVSADILYREAEKCQVTHYEGGAAVPIMMERMLGRPLSYNISSLKFIGYGGSKIPSASLKRLAAAFPQLDIYTGYGLTESAGMISRPYKELPPQKFGSAGVAIPGVTIMVEAGGCITDAPGITGEILVKGPNIMLGYYQNEEETCKAIKDGYLYTGDIGYLDEDGYLYLCGRKKNVIMARGFSVYAEEVEDCLLGSGLIEDCLVYGETEAKGMEVLCADIVRKHALVSADEIRRYCGSRLAGYKQPQNLRFVESIRKTATGKSVRTVSTGAPPQTIADYSD